MSESAPSPPVNELIDKIAAGSNAMAGEAAQALDQVSQTAAEIVGDIQSAVPAATPVSPAGGGGGEHTGARDSSNADASSGAAAETSEVRRLLAIEVPIIVQLGIRRMTVGEVMRFSVGAILEFQKGSDDELELLAANKTIGKGFAVKVGENFGIKLSSIGSVKETIRKLGLA